MVGDLRSNEGKKVVGSLLLGLYDDADLLEHVGFTSTIPAKDKPALTGKLEKLVAPPGPRTTWEAQPAIGSDRSRFDGSKTLRRESPNGERGVRGSMVSARTDCVRANVEVLRRRSAMPFPT